ELGWPLTRPLRRLRRPACALHLSLGATPGAGRRAPVAPALAVRPLLAFRPAFLCCLRRALARQRPLPHERLALLGDQGRFRLPSWAAHRRPRRRGFRPARRALRQRALRRSWRDSLRPLQPLVPEPPRRSA